MNILHVFSANIFSGAVAYALALAEKQRAEGHQVWLIADGGNFSTNLPHLKTAIDKRSYWQRFKNVLIIKKTIQKHQIDVVHAHSRAASWVCYVALRGAKIPLISTIHGRQGVHTSSKSMDIYGEQIITVCENLKKHLTDELNINPQKINVIPNGINFKQFINKNIDNQEIKKQTQLKTITYIGRFGGGKGIRLLELLMFVMPFLFEKFDNLQLQLVGGTLDELPAEAQTQWSILNQKYANRLHCVGFTTHVLDYIRAADLVIGAGRVAIEALAAQKPVLAAGEAVCEGLVRLDNFENALASNFGDVLPFQFRYGEWNYEQIKQEITTFFDNAAPILPESLTIVKEKIYQRYNIEKVYAAVMEIYENKRFKRRFPKHIPALMYHKIPDEPIDSPNKIFVTKHIFRTHLEFLKKNNFTPITFADYQNYVSGKKELKNFPKKPIFLTFDDGYTDNFTNLLPLMNEFGFKGTLFLLGDFSIDHNVWDVAKGDFRSPIMNAAQKKAFADADWEIGAHTMSHQNLTQLPDNEAFMEIINSKKALEDFFGQAIISFAYPFGLFAEKHEKMVKEAGFSFGIATDSGGLNVEDNRLKIFRVNIFPDDTEAQLRKKTATWYRKYYYWKRGK